MPEGSVIPDSQLQTPRRSDLRKRTISALILAPIVLFAVYWGGYAFLSLIAVAVLLMAYEWSHLAYGDGWPAHAILQAAAGLLAIGCASDKLFSEIVGVPPLSAAGVAILGGSILASAYARIRKREVSWAAIGVPYIALGALAMVWLRQQDDVGLLLILWLLCIVWAMDIGAYFSGRTIGGPRLAPRASPNKTWAGLIGGMVCAGLAGGMVGYVSGLAPALPLGLASAAIGVWSQVGDIAESAVKRHFGVKDMSNLIPGHGGILDRVDGLLFAAPAVMVTAILFSLPWS